MPLKEEVREEQCAGGIAHCTESSASRIEPNWEKGSKGLHYVLRFFRRKVKAILAIVIISWYFYKHFLPLFDHLHVKIVRKPLWVNFMHNLITFIWRQRETRRIPCHFQHFWHQKPPAQRITPPPHWVSDDDLKIHARYYYVNLFEKQMFGTS